MIKNDAKSSKINLILAGTQKGGTSALDIYLRKHNEILMANTKEVHYFDTENNFSSEIDYATYHSNFSLPTNRKIIGESTPIYMYWYHAPQRMWAYNPEMKIIVVLRNPIDRAYSHWNMERERGKEQLSFFEAIHNEQSRCKESLPLQHRVYSYIDRGYYCEQLKRLFHFFPKESVLVLKSQELKNNLTYTLNEISDFLEIEQFKKIKHKNIHSRKYTKINENDKYYLKDVYNYEIKQLEKLLSWDCSDWLA